MPRFQLRDVVSRLPVVLYRYPVRPIASKPFIPIPEFAKALHQKVEIYQGIKNWQNAKTLVAIAYEARRPISSALSIITPLKINDSKTELKHNALQGTEKTLDSFGEHMALDMALCAPPFQKRQQDATKYIPITPRFFDSSQTELRMAESEQVQFERNKQQYARQKELDIPGRVRTLIPIKDSGSGFDALGSGYTSTKFRTLIPIKDAGSGFDTLTVPAGLSDDYFSHVAARLSKNHEGRLGAFLKRENLLPPDVLQEIENVMMQDSHDKEALRRQIGSILTMKEPNLPLIVVHRLLRRDLDMACEIFFSEKLQDLDAFKAIYYKYMAKDLAKPGDATTFYKMLASYLEHHELSFLQHIFNFPISFLCERCPKEFLQRICSKSKWTSWEYELNRACLAAKKGCVESALKCFMPAISPYPRYTYSRYVHAVHSLEFTKAVCTILDADIDTATGKSFTSPLVYIMLRVYQRLPAQILILLLDNVIKAGNKDAFVMIWEHVRNVPFWKEYNSSFPLYLELLKGLRVLEVWELHSEIEQNAINLCFTSGLQDRTLATDILHTRFELHVYRESRDFFHDLIDHYLRFFDPSILHKFGLGHYETSTTSGPNYPRLAPDFKVLCLLLSAYFRSAPPSSIIKIYNTFQDALTSLDPSIIPFVTEKPDLFNVFIEGFSRRGVRYLRHCSQVVADLKGLTQITLDSNGTRVAPPDLTSYLNVLQALIRQNKYADVYSIVKYVEQHGTEAQLTIAYNMLIRRFAKRKMPRQLRDICQRFVSRGLVVDQYTLKGLHRVVDQNLLEQMLGQVSDSDESEEGLGRELEGAQAAQLPDV